MWFRTKRQDEAKELLADAKERVQEMKPQIAELHKIYDDNHIYRSILRSLGAPNGYR